MHVLDGDPVLRLFRSYPADLEFVLRLLRRYRSDVNRIRENVLNRREVPDEPSVFGIELFELRVDIAKSLLPVPPSRAWYPLVLQFPADVVRSVTVKCVCEQLADNRRGILVDDEMILVRRVFFVTERREASGELTFLCLYVVCRVNLAGNIPAVMLVEIRAYRNESVVAFAVNVIGQPDIPDMILRKEFLKEKPEVKVVPRKSA